MWGTYIAVVRRQDAEGPPDWMNPHYLSDEHHDAKHESVFGHFVVPFMTHAAFVQISTRIITESITGGGGSGGSGGDGGGGGGGSSGRGGDYSDEDHHSHQKLQTPRVPPLLVGKWRYWAIPRIGRRFTS